MPMEYDAHQMIFGFKLKYLRTKHGLSLEELAHKTGMSKSFLHDIEKGKKYPRPNKIQAIADAFGVDYNYMVSTEGEKAIQPVLDLLDSEFMRTFPLSQFGLEPDKVFELFSNIPDKVNAFVSTILKITRSYQLERENIFMAALRSYQDLYDNYFPDLEEAADSFSNLHSLTKPGADRLEQLLQREYGIKTDRNTLKTYPTLHNIRSVFIPDHKTLY